MTVSASTARHLQRITDPGGVLMLLEITHPNFAEPVRLVNDTRDLVALGFNWIALPFAITLPNDTSKESPRARLQMDNVGRDLSADLESLPPRASLKATIRMVHRTTPGVIDYEFRAPLSGVRIMGPTVTASMGRDDMLRTSAVLKRFDPGTAPSLFGT